MLEKDSGTEHEESASPLLQHRPDGPLKVVGSPHLRRDKLQVQRSSRPFDLFQSHRAEARIPEDAHALGVRDGRDEKFQPFGVNIEILQAQPREISAWAREREDKA